MYLNQTNNFNTCLIWNVTMISRLSNSISPLLQCCLCHGKRCEIETETFSISKAPRALQVQPYPVPRRWINKRLSNLFMGFPTSLGFARYGLCAVKLSLFSGPCSWRKFRFAFIRLSWLILILFVSSMIIFKERRIFFKWLFITSVILKNTR